MPDTSGPMWHRQFAFYDPDSSCWRTSQGTFLSDSDLYSETWPRSGMTRAGCAYALPMSAPPTDELASSSLLPTPRTSDTNGAGVHGTGGQDLRTVVSLLPTPTTQPATGNGHARNLGKEVQLLPTPAANDSHNSPEAHLRKKPGREQVTSLQVIADYGLLPTGGRINPPSPAGNESSDGELPGQLSLGAPDASD